MRASTPDPHPYFFLSYAHTPERPWVERLFHDIRVEVLERTTLPVNSQVGFMDCSSVPQGNSWRDEVARALATCGVLVPLYSPRYFTSAECGVAWHAFGQRILVHQAQHPGTAPAIVPALWTPVDPEDLPVAAQRIQMRHSDLGDEYAQEGFYTLIKNGLYKKEYTTAVQRLAVHIIKAAENVRLCPCPVRDLGPPRNAFDLPGRRAPADRRLNVIVVAPTTDRLPAGRCEDYYGRAATDWNPFHPRTQLVVAEFAASVARLSSYEPTVLGLDEGCEFLAKGDPEVGLGLLLVDAWSVTDPELAPRLAELDTLGGGWVGTMVLWNREDPQTRERSGELRAKLMELLPHRLGRARPFTPTNSGAIDTLEEFRTKLPDVLEGALHCYLNYAEAHPPRGTIPARPRLARRGE